MRLLKEDEIRALITPRQALDAVRGAFVALAEERVTMPPPLELDFPHQHADLHVKGAFVSGLPHFAFKLVTAFYDNRDRGVPVMSGLSLLLDSDTGAIVALLFDNGFLTELRTGAAGALAADLLAPGAIDTVGIVGSGSQARFQLESLLLVRQPRRILVYGRTHQRAVAYAAEMHELHDVEVELADTIEHLCRRARLIVTATTAREPVIHADWLVPGTHLTAVGSDLPDKQELAVDVLARADVVVADRLDQCLRSGEIHHAVAARVLEPGRVVELAAVAAGRAVGRTTETDITVADLTGVGIQDVAVADVIGGRLRELGADAPGRELDSPHSR